MSTSDNPREYLLSQMPEQGICAEIGVHKGVFSRRILKRTNPKQLHLIDPWAHIGGNTYKDSWYGGLGENGQSIMDGRFSFVKNLFNHEIKNGQVVVHRGYSDSIVEKFEDYYFDWIYIDGDHQYAFVKNDLEMYYQKIRNGGILAGDDYGSEGWWGNGVKRAVDEFREKDKRLGIEVKGNQFIIKKQG